MYRQDGKTQLQDACFNGHRDKEQKMNVIISEICCYLKLGEISRTSLEEMLLLGEVETTAPTPSSL